MQLKEQMKKRWTLAATTAGVGAVTALGLALGDLGSSSGDLPDSIRLRDGVSVAEAAELESGIPVFGNPVMVADDSTFSSPLDDSDGVAGVSVGSPAGDSVHTTGSFDSPAPMPSGGTTGVAADSPDSPALESVDSPVYMEPAPAVTDGGDSPDYVAPAPPAPESVDSPVYVEPAPAPESADSPTYVEPAPAPESVDSPDYVAPAPPAPESVDSPDYASADSGSGGSFDS